MSQPKRKVDLDNVFYITSDTANPVREAAIIGANIQTALRRKELAEILFHEIPGQDSSVFSRRITIIKQTKNTPGLESTGDDPDLEDVYGTDMPWMGKVTFKNASRQFRSRYHIGVAVDVVREIDGYLYHLSEKALGERYHGIDRGYCVVDVERHPYDPRSHKVTVNPVHRADEVMLHFGTAPAIPKSLISELTAIGYRHINGEFVAAGDHDSRIICRLYGKLNRK